MNRKRNLLLARALAVCAFFVLVNLLAACQAPTPAAPSPAPSTSLPLARPSATLPLAPTRTPTALGDATAAASLDISGLFVFAPGDGSIWIRGVKETTPRVLFKASAAAFAESPVLSPDEKQVAYSLNTLNKDGTITKDIRVINVDGTNAHLVAAPPNVKTTYSNPDWSPDGKQLFITQDYPVPPASEYSEVDLIPASGGALKKVVEGRSSSVSGDGKKITFLRFDYQTFTVGLWVANIDGSNAKQLVDNDTFLAMLGPRFSPDGQLILFAASGPPNKKLPGISYARPPEEDPAVDPCAVKFLSLCVVEKAYADGLPWDLWTVTVDGSKFDQITNVGSDSPYPAWSPDGKYMAFFDVTGIYVIDRDKKVIYPVATRGGHGGFDWR